jgi:hypothetical protein
MISCFNVAIILSSRSMMGFVVEELGFLNGVRIVNIGPEDSLFIVVTPLK